MPHTNFTYPLTRRGLLGVVTGLVTLRTAFADAKQDTAYPEPGKLAQSRLKPEIVALMTGATRFSARRRRELSSEIPSGIGSISRENAPIPSVRFPSAMPNLGRPKPEQAQMARRLAALLLRDELWMRDDSFRYGREPEVPFQPDFVFNFADTFPGITVSVCPSAHSIYLNWVQESTHSALSTMIAFDPVGNEMIAFIKEAFPGDTAAQSLTFVPKPPMPLPVPTRPPQIASKTWAKMMALKPGMTRADVLAVFETEGGLSNRLHRSYLLTPPTKDGKYLKINVEYAPPDIPLLWRGGSGYFQNPEDVPRAARGREMPDDIILSLSPVYWGYMIMD